MSSVWWDRIGADCGAEEVVLHDSGSRTKRGIFAIVLGGLVAGACDLTYAVTFWFTQGVPPIHVLQSIASGLLGANSFQDGWASAFLGVTLHFLIALAAAAAYFLASRNLHILVERAPLFGALYGAAIYFFMRQVVLPISAAPRFQSTALAAWTDFAAHVFLIGLPIALIVRRCTSSSTEPSSSVARV